MAETAPSEDPVPLPNRTAPEDARANKSAPSDPGNATFSNTNKHVAGQQTDGAGVERFANTKLNIALINDPKNGPRFTLTKRESGLVDKEDAEKAAEPPATEAEKTTAEPSATKSKPATADDDEASKTNEGLRTRGDGQEPSSESDSAGKTESAEAGGQQNASAATADTKPEGRGPLKAAEPPSKVPIDSSKTFVGHNGTYYDESWRWMDWRGTRRSWNWPAALSFGHWFAYRRLYTYAGLYLIWLGGLAAATVNDVPVLAVILLALLVVGLTGVYGNTLYFFAFRRAVGHVTEKGEGSYQELQAQLAAAGGTSLIGVGIMGILSLAAIVGVLTMTLSVRGGFFLNFWPFS